MRKFALVLLLIFSLNTFGQDSECNPKVRGINLGITPKKMSETLRVPITTKSLVNIKDKNGKSQDVTFMFLKKVSLSRLLRYKDTKDISEVSVFPLDKGRLVFVQMKFFNNSLYDVRIAYSDRSAWDDAKEFVNSTGIKIMPLDHWKVITSELATAKCSDVIVEIKLDKTLVISTTNVKISQKVKRLAKEKFTKENL